MKKILSLVALIVTMVCIVTVTSLNVSAAGTDFASATEIDVNASYTENITNEYENDFYKFTLTSPGRVFINFKHENLADASEYWNATLYDDSINEITTFSFLGTDTNFDSKKIGLGDGTYYLKITGGDYYFDYSHKYDRSNYELSVLFLDTESWERENNENFRSATMIGVNEECNGTINDSSDFDFYKFSIDLPGSIYINFKHKDLADSEEYWRATLYDMNTNEISVYSFSGVEANDTSYKIGLDKGTYYLSIIGGDYYFDYSHKFDTCDYNFTLKYEPSEFWEKENNNDFRTATFVTCEKMYKGSINDDTDIDFYKVDLENSQTVDFSFFCKDVRDSGEYYQLVVYNAKTNELYKHSFSGNASSQKFNLYLGAGSYYFSIIGGDFYFDYSHKYTTSEYSFSISTQKAPAQVKNLKVTKTTDSIIRIQWNKVEEAEKYKVYYSTNGKNWKTEVSTDNIQTVKNLKDGTSYRFKVKAIAGEEEGRVSSVIKTSTRVKKVKLESVKSPKDSRLVVRWNDVRGSHGYVIEYSTSKKFIKKATKSYREKDDNAEKITLKKLKSDKRYYVRVRAYRIVNDKTVYGSWSSVKSVKVK